MSLFLQRRHAASFRAAVICCLCCTVVFADHEQLELHVDPASGNDEHGNGTKFAPLRSLEAAAAKLAAILRDTDRPIGPVVVNLEHGYHRVPPGGLYLTSEHTPRLAHSVEWRGRPPNGHDNKTSIHGGVQLQGAWLPVSDPSLPAGVMAMHMPPELKGKRLRQLYVGGERANRTRIAADYLNLTYSGGNDDASLLLACNLTGRWRIGGKTSHWAAVAENAAGDFTAAAYGVPHGGWTAANGHVSAETVTIAFNNGKGTDVAQVTPPNCDRIQWSNHRNPVWDKMSPAPPPPPPTPPSPSHTGYRSNSTEPLDWLNPGDVELVYTGLGSTWSESRCTVDSVAHLPGSAANASLVVMKQPCIWNLVHAPWHPLGASPPVFVENVRSHLRRPGQWYYDLGAAQILYFPHKGENMSEADVWVPVEETLVHHNGSAAHVWSNVVFEFATWLRPMEGKGFVEGQSSACSVCPVGTKMKPGCGGSDIYELTPGNVVVTNGTDISFVNSTFQHLGAYASAAAGGSQRVTWQGCTFRDVSAGAVMLGSLDTCAETNVSRWDANFSVADCTVINMPVEFTGASAVMLTYVDSSVVEHNLLANLSYSAISLGWGWGRTGCRRGRNQITANRVENPLRTLCCDGGALYTLGPQPGSTIARNYLTSNGSNNGGVGNAVYHDEGSGGFIDSLNVLDGAWAHYCGLNLPGGGFGIQKSCPGVHGEPEDCMIHFDNNTLHIPSNTKDQCQGAISKKPHNKGKWVGGNESGNIWVPVGVPLPAEAAAIAQAAGPRY